MENNYVQSLLNTAKEYLPVIVFVSGIVFYASVYYGLPPRLAKAEEEIRSLQLQMAQINSTLQIVASDTRDIKGVLMHGGR